MLPCVSQIVTKNKTFPLNKSLASINSGIYVAICLICHRQYVRHSVNALSTRWLSYRINWTNQIIRKTATKQPLSRHYSMFHGAINKPPVYEVYTIVFVEQLSFHSLDTCQDKCFHKLNAPIIDSIFLPRAK